MNKEVAEIFKRLDLFNLDIKKNIEDIYNRLYITFDDNEISYLLDYIENLKQENKKLHNKINKAIEYINGAWEMGCYTKTVALYSEELEELLEILKESE